MPLFTDAEIRENKKIREERAAEILKRDTERFEAMPRTIHIAGNTWDLYFLDLQTGDLSEPTIQAYQDTYLTAVYLGS